MMMKSPLPGKLSQISGKPANGVAILLLLWQIKRRITQLAEK